MKGFKEIVTKAVIGKGKKKFTNNYELIIDDAPDTVLGCWVINHSMSGKNNNGNVQIDGNFDVNIWYSYDNNTKTSVVSRRVNYREVVNVRLREESMLTDSSEIIIRSLKSPVCSDVSVEGKCIKYVIDKELGIEIIGDAKVKVQIEDDYDDYDIIEDVVNEVKMEEIMNEIDNNVNENYINDEIETL